MHKNLKQIYLATPIIPQLWRAIKSKMQRDPLLILLYQKIFERGKLNLSWMPPEELSPAAESVIFPVHYPLHGREDAPLADMLFLLNVAKGRRAKRILEVGTYRARTTYAFFLNCLGAQITSYDIHKHESEYRELLTQQSRVSLRLGSFQEAEKELTQEEPYDLIFIDGSHRVDDVVKDSLLAFKIVTDGGLIIWHDYRCSGYSTDLLRVPEGLARLPPSYSICGVEGTTCAVFENKRA